MLILFVVLAAMIFFGLIKFALKASWGLLKLLFAIGAFLICPALFIVFIVIGLIGACFVPLLLIALSLFAFRRL